MSPHYWQSLSLLHCQDSSRFKMCQAKVFMAKPAKSSGHNCSAQPNLRSSRGLGLLFGVEGTKASELYSTPICLPLHTHPFDALLEAVLVIVIRILVRNRPLRTYSKHFQTTFGAFAILSCKRSPGDGSAVSPDSLNEAKMSYLMRHMWREDGVPAYGCWSGFQVPCNLLTLLLTSRFSNDVNAYKLHSNSEAQPRSFPKRSDKVTGGLSIRV